MKRKVVLVIILLLTLTLTACKENISDSQKFAEEYTEVPEYNVFVYKGAEEIIKILEH